MSIVPPAAGPVSGTKGTTPEQRLTNAVAMAVVLIDEYKLPDPHRWTFATATCAQSHITAHVATPEQVNAWADMLQSTAEPDPDRGVYRTTGQLDAHHIEVTCPLGGAR